jgi:hypothetical protein
MIVCLVHAVYNMVWEISSFTLSDQLGTSVTAYRMKPSKFFDHTTYHSESAMYIPVYISANNQLHVCTIGNFIKQPLIYCLSANNSPYS